MFMFQLRGRAVLETSIYIEIYATSPPQYAVVIVIYTVYSIVRYRTLLLQVFCWIAPALVGIRFQRAVHWCSAATTISWVVLGLFVALLWKWGKWENSRVVRHLLLTFYPPLKVYELKTFTWKVLSYSRTCLETLTSLWYMDIWGRCSSSRKVRCTWVAPYPWRLQTTETMPLTKQ